MRYKIFRAGDFYNDSEHPNSCAVKGPVRIFYHAEIIISTFIPDERGFFVDHEEIDKLMKPILTKGMSCEKMAISAVNHLDKFLEDLHNEPAENPTQSRKKKVYFKVEEIRVKIGERTGNSYFEAIKNPVPYNKT